MAGRSFYNIRSHYTKSSARLMIVDQFKFGSIELEGDQEPTTIEDLKRLTVSADTGFYPNMPLILQSNGDAWDIGNAYLLCRLEQHQPWEMATLSSAAKDLLIYLAFCEHNDIDPLKMPEAKALRPTYKFRRELGKHVLQGYGVSTASRVMNSVVNFYKTIASHGLIKPWELGRKPYEKLVKVISTFNEQGFSMPLQVSTSDLAIKTPKTEVIPGRIMDGGQLRPLTEFEAECLWKGMYRGYIKPDGSSPTPEEKPICSLALRLIMETALLTGMRKGSILTLAWAHIEEMYAASQKDPEAKSIRLHPTKNESGLQIDVKGRRPYPFWFPKALVERLYIYVNAEDSAERRKRSAYGNNQNNYLFLTKTGQPYQTAKREILDRQDPDSAPSVNAPNFKVQQGTSLTRVFNIFVGKLQALYPDVKDFSFHDLRATFGMCIVRYGAKEGWSNETTRALVQRHLGHAKGSVSTDSYLNYEEFIEKNHAVDEAVFKAVFGVWADPEAAMKSSGGGK